MLPKQFQAALERVRAGADVMPRRQLEKVLVAELGQGWEAQVASFDFQPLAAASIGQVRPRRRWCLRAAWSGQQRHAGPLHCAALAPHPRLRPAPSLRRRRARRYTRACCMMGGGR